MGKQNKKYLFIIIIGVIFIFSWLWTEGFGIYPRYEYGSTIEKAINFWYQRGQSTINLSSVLSTIDVNHNEELVFYKTSKDTLMTALVKKKWNNKWIVVGRGGEVSFNPIDIQQNNNLNSEPTVNWMWCNLNEFGITFGIAYNPNVEAITVGDRSAVLLNKNTDRCIWYYTDKTNYTNTDLKPILDVKAYNKAGNLIYSYYP